MLRPMLVFAVALVTVLFAGQVAAVEVADAVITTAVVDREHVDEVEAFPVQGGKLFCFCRTTGASHPTTVVHLWYYNDEQVSRVELPVNSPDWRTWSAKEFLPAWRGQWRVVIQDAFGRVLQEMHFQLI